MAYVYRHIRLDKNEPFYIGIGSDLTYKRANEKTRRNDIWNRIVMISGYRVEIMVDDISFSDAKKKEIDLIKLYGRKDKNNGTLCNLTDGGDGTKGSILSDEHKKAISRAQKGRIIMTPERRLFLSKIRKGKLFTQEQKDKLKERCKTKNKYFSPELRLYRSNKMKANNPSKNKTGKDGFHFKVNVLVFKGGIFINEYCGVNDTALKLNLKATKISACILGKRKTHGGYTFERIDI